MEKLLPVRLDGAYFAVGEKRFIPIGAHWVPAIGLHWPTEWDEENVEADFTKMKNLGFNTVRFDLFWAWFEPYPGVFHKQAFEQFDFLLKMANKYVIYLHPTFFIGNETGYYDVPWRHGRHPHADPEMLRLQTDHVREFAKRYHNESAILAWDLTDEPPFWISRGTETTDAMAINWTRLLSRMIRRYDSNHLICVGTDQEELRHGPFRPDNIVDEVDFLSSHPYPIYLPELFPDPMVSERATYSGAFQVALSSGTGLPVMIHELGSSSAQYSPEAIASYNMMSMYSSLAAGANGFLLWAFTDATPEGYRRVPYSLAPHETQFGLTTCDRKDRPAGAVFRRFIEIINQLDLNGVEPEEPVVAIIVPHEWAKPHADYSNYGLPLPAIMPFIPHNSQSTVTGIKQPDMSDVNLWLMGSWLNSFIIARRADLKVCFPREIKDDWKDIPMLWLPSPLTSTKHDLVHIYTTFWEDVLLYIHEGGNVYASFCADAAIPNMEYIFGAKLVDHKAIEYVEITIQKPLGSLKVGEKFCYKVKSTNPNHWAVTFEVKGGEVIATDQDGMPALITFNNGKGKTLISAFPIESYLACTPEIFEKRESTYRIFKAFAEWCDVGSFFHTNNPKIEIAALKGKNRGFAVLTNHGCEDIEVIITAKEILSQVSLIKPEGRKNIEIEKNQFKLLMKAYDGSLLAWRK